MRTARAARRYVTPFVEVLGRFHTTVPIVVLIEPDSLGNVVTNAGSGACAPSVVDAYKRGITLAVKAIAKAAVPTSTGSNPRTSDTPCSLLPAVSACLIPLML